MCDDTLSAEEVKAITAHLSVNVPALREIFATNIQGLTELVKSGTVMNMRRKSPLGSSQPCSEDTVYRRGKMSSMATLVLSGKLVVRAGNCDDLFMLVLT